MVQNLHLSLPDSVSIYLSISIATGYPANKHWNTGGAIGRCEVHFPQIFQPLWQEAWMLEKIKCKTKIKCIQSGYNN
jgi:hypothetical protein